MAQRIRYSEETRQKAIAAVVAGASYAEVARQLNVGTHAIAYWMKAYQGNGAKSGTAAHQMIRLHVTLGLDEVGHVLANLNGSGRDLETEVIEVIDRPARRSRAVVEPSSLPPAPAPHVTNKQEQKLKPSGQKVLAYIRSQTGPVSPDSVAAACKIEGALANFYLGKFVDMKLARKISRGKYEVRKS